jgi:pentatricopeptide repeat protein
LKYLLGGLLKKGRAAEACGLVEATERLKIGGIPSPLTYELLAYHACKAGKMDSAMQILKEMFLANLALRITMHTALIKGYFYAGIIEDVCKYVGDMSTRGRHSAKRSSGRAIDAGRILFELMDKGLRPDRSAYVIVLKWPKICTRWARGIWLLN